MIEIHPRRKPEPITPAHYATLTVPAFDKSGNRSKPARFIDGEDVECARHGRHRDWMLFYKGRPGPVALRCKICAQDANRKNHANARKTQAPREKPKKVSRKDLFLSGQPVFCALHGEHREYTVCGSHLSCRICTRGRAKKINDARDPLERVMLHCYRTIRTAPNRYGRRRNWDVKIDVAYLRQIYENQGGCCAYSGIAFSDEIRPSVDRIDSQQGYIPGNVQLVTARVNRMKSDMPECEFLHLCARIVGRQTDGKK